MSYKIIRFYRDHEDAREVITTGLTLEQAQAHCKNSETSSESCLTIAGKKRTELMGPWFDGYEEE